MQMRNAVRTDVMGYSLWELRTIPETKRRVWSASGQTKPGSKRRIWQLLPCCARQSIVLDSVGKHSTCCSKRYCPLTDPWSLSAAPPADSMSARLAPDSTPASKSGSSLQTSCVCVCVSWRLGHQGISRYHRHHLFSQNSMLASLLFL